MHSRRYNNDADSLVKLTLMLEVRLQELSSRLQHRMNITIERNSDVLDDIELSVPRDLTIWSLDKGFAKLRYLTAALDRIAAGDYAERGVRHRSQPLHVDLLIAPQAVAEPNESREAGVLRKDGHSGWCLNEASVHMECTRT